MTDLKARQLQAGAIFEEGGMAPLSFGNDDRGLLAAREEVAIGDRSDWGLLEVGGGDRLRFLHNQTTNDFHKLKAGEGCDTVFVTSTARTIDLVTAYLRPERVLLLVSPHQNGKLLEWMDRYIFPLDEVELRDLTAEVNTFTLIGNQSQQLLSEWLEPELLTSPAGSNFLVDIDGIELILGVGSGLALPGYNLIVSRSKGAEIWQKFTGKMAVPIGSQVYEKLRILQGRPKPNSELREDYNPLEAGLWQAISFDKGCYIGQETIARLNTYKGVKQRLWGIQLNQKVPEGASVTAGGEKVGTVTSCTDTETGGFALAYIRTKAGGIGLKVRVGAASGEVVPLPFVSHE